MVALAILACILVLPLSVGSFSRAPFLTVQFVTFAALLGLALRRRIGRPAGPGAIMVGLFAWIAAWAGVSTVFSVDRSASLPELMMWIWLLGLSVLLISTLHDERVRGLLIGALLISVLIQVLYGFFIWWARGDPNAFQFGTFYAPNLYAGYIVLLAPIMVAIALAQTKAVPFLASAFGAAFVLCGLAFSGSRGGVVAGAVALTCLVAVATARGGPRVLMRTLCVAALVVTLGWSFAGPLMLRSSASANLAAPLSAKSAANPQSLQMRRDWASEAVSIAAERPLNGSGLGTFGVLFAERESSKQWSRYVHNDYLQVLAEGGYPMAAGFFILIVGSILMAWKKANRSTGEGQAIMLGVAAGLTGAGLHLIVDHDWSSVGFASAHLALAAIAVGRTREEAPA